MIPFVIYNAGGAILRLGFCQECGLEAQIHSSGEYVVSNIANIHADYIDQGETTPRPTQLSTLNKLTLTADGLDTITISNTPTGTFTAVNLATRETISGAISGIDTFATTIAGTYTITIVAFPYLDFDITIEAV